MELLLQRDPSAKGATLGELLVDGSHQCFTCEDDIRELPGVPVEQWKVLGQTAIPAGRYRVTIDYSPKFKKPMPHVLGVPGFDGIRIHTGNRPEDTEGCILVGSLRSEASVVGSTAAFNELYPKLLTAIDAGEEVWITIKNPVVVE